ncbi:QacE family quaternary ammonium compound efflux SMR transporter [Paenibacillus sp. LMG 31457]|uniref:QacE family quaternary ammonium compound efflux SMR transporter n=2 Tax=Paenibacillus planticolens TaxID=2654976 RepID=A0ABX1ZVU0_9BACL|nr:QacE family quaternary ammonium compound efflux SMR transporter [Paenibacillus planticolens]
MNWTFLLLAILFETVGTTAMKMSAGFTKIGPAVVMGICYILCFTLLTLALKQLDVSLAYAIWSGVGTALITIIGIWWFNESVSTLKVISIVLIILGVIGLHISSSGDEKQSNPAPKQDLQSAAGYKKE